MALPEAARKQLEEAERMHAEVYPDGDAKEAPDLKEVPNDAEPSPESAEAAPAEGEGLSEVQGEAGQNEGTPPAEEVDWEHKYKVLQGKYNAEIPRLQQQNEGLQGQIGDLQAQITSITESMNEAPQQREPTKLLKDDEIEDYGQDMIDVVKRAAREEFEPELARLEDENQQLRGLLGGMQQQTALDARGRMLADLDEQQGNWRELNQDPSFLGWLENVDPYSGTKKLDLLRQAFENNNTARVLAFFKGFLNENAVTNPQTQTPSAAAEPQVNLETLVAPGTPAEGGDVRAQEGAPTGKTWSQADIQKFYSDVNRGVYRDRPDEKERQERDIFLAQKEGRMAF